MATYHVEYGEPQANSCRLIERETSANPGNPAESAGGGAS